MSQIHCRRVKEHPERLQETRYWLSDPRYWRENWVPSGLSGSDHNNDLVFEGGFSINEELTTLEPRTPFDNAESNHFPYVFLWANDPESVQSLAKRVPIVQERPSDFPLNWINDQDYSYLLYTYKVANPSPDMRNPEQKFIYTGSQDMKASPAVTKNAFIPFEELEKRLGGGNYPIEERRQAYLQDWLAYAANTISLNKKKKISPVIPREFPRYSLPPFDERPLVGLEDLHDGAHLSIRDSSGLFDPQKTVRFLSHLLAPKNTREIGADLGKYVFSRWCHVAYIAAIAAKDPYSVKARFWSIPKSLDQKIEFIFTKPWLLTKDGITELHNSVFFQGRSSQQIKDCLSLLEEAAVVKDLWGKAVARALEKISDAKGKPSGKSFIVLSDKDFTPNWEANHELLGEHPQGLYRIWVSRADAKEMKKQNYALPDRDFPSSRGLILKYQTELAVSASNTPTTQTRITKTRLDSAGNWPRVRSQNAVMQNVSANAVAGVLWKEEGIRTAEWLHRSAYSYGGLGTENPDSSQTMGNLVFGTYECNTAMIRFESYIKRLVQTGAPDFQVNLRTDVKVVDEWGTPPWSWLVKQLQYTWDFAAPNFPGYGIQKTHTFDLFSRTYPTLFEVDFDAAFDSLWWGNNAEDDLRDMVVLFLLLTQFVRL